VEVVLPLEHLGVSPERWDRFPLDAKAIIVNQHARLIQLEEAVRDLQARLKKDSSNSHKPPSSDPPGKQREKKKPSGKPSGAQKGHPGYHRPMVPLEQVDEVHKHFPDRCAHCEHVLTAEGDIPGVVGRHQIFELPKIKVTIIEHQTYERACYGCGKVTRAKLPEAVSQSSVGPQVQAEIAYLVGKCHLSRRRVVEYAATSWGLPLCMGTVHRIEQNVSQALEKPYVQVVKIVKAARVRNLDETGWKEKGKRRYLWSAGCAKATVFKIAPSRGAEVLKDLFGDALQNGHSITDRHKGYDPEIPMDQRGICWAHLKRDFKKIQQVGGLAGQLGDALQFRRKQARDLWYRFKDGGIDRAQLQEHSRPIRESIKRLLEEGQHYPKVGGACKDMLRYEQAMWNYLFVEGMEPTNNAAERALRQAVIWRKGSFGTQSLSGSQFVERILTVAETCRQNGRNMLDYLVSAVQSNILGHAAPSLILSVLALILFVLPDG